MTLWARPLFYPSPLPSSLPGSRQQYGMVHPCSEWCQAVALRAVGVSPAPPEPPVPRIQPRSECVAHVLSQNRKLGLFPYLIGEETGLWASPRSQGLDPTSSDLFCLGGGCWC